MIALILDHEPAGARRASLFLAPIFVFLVAGQNSHPRVVDVAEGVRRLLVAGNYFSTLGAEMALGRAFAPEECQTPGAGPVVVLSHSFWRRRFGADPSLLRKNLTLNSQPFTVIGVTSPDFHGAELEPPDV